jgi:hypothetical protein
LYVGIKIELADKGGGYGGTNSTDNKNTWSSYFSCVMSHGFVQPNILVHRTNLKTFAMIMLRIQKHMFSIFGKKKLHGIVA